MIYYIMVFLSWDYLRFYVITVIRQLGDLQFFLYLLFIEYNNMLCCVIHSWIQLSHIFSSFQQKPKRKENINIQKAHLITFSFTVWLYNRKTKRSGPANSLVFTSNHLQKCFRTTLFRKRDKAKKYETSLQVIDRKSTRLNSSHSSPSRMPSSA